jgi:hypothetical protein
VGRYNASNSLSNAAVVSAVHIELVLETVSVNALRATGSATTPLPCSLECGKGNIETACAPVQNIAREHVTSTFIIKDLGKHKLNSLFPERSAEAALAATSQGI